MPKITYLIRTGLPIAFTIVEKSSKELMGFPSKATIKSPGCTSFEEIIVVLVGYSSGTKVTTESSPKYLPKDLTSELVTIGQVFSASSPTGGGGKCGIIPEYLLIPIPSVSAVKVISNRVNFTLGDVDDCLSLLMPNDFFTESKNDMFSKSICTQQGTHED